MSYKSQLCRYVSPFPLFEFTIHEDINKLNIKRFNFIMVTNITPHIPLYHSFYTYVRIKELIKYPSTTNRTNQRILNKINYKSHQTRDYD